MAGKSPAEINEQFTELAEKFSAGKAALEKGGLKKLLAQFDDALADINTDAALLHDAKTAVDLQAMLEACFEGSFAADAAKAVEPANVKTLTANIDNTLAEKAPPELKAAGQALLDLFHFPEFLTRIYGEDGWDDLIEALVRRSNFTVHALFEQRLKRIESKTLFTTLQGKSQKRYSWRETQEQVTAYQRAIAHYLESISQPDGMTAFLMENSIQMAMLDIACLKGGFVNIMIPDNSVEQHVTFILNQTEAPLLFVSNEKQLAKIKAVKHTLKHLQQVVLIQGQSAQEWVVSLRDFIKVDADDADPLIEKRRAAITTDSLATVMYTSGTTGEPKGITFNQMNIVFKRFSRALAIPGIGERDRYLAYLPLCHTFGRYLEMMGAIFWGAEYVFMENPSAQTMVANMQKVKPSIFISIPKKWMQLHEMVAAKVDVELDDDEEIKAALDEVTGGKLRWGLSAAGYLSPDIFEFFQRYGVELMSGFGMTEATGGITMTPPGKYRPDSLGLPLPGIKTKLGDDGELLISGAYVTPGIYKAPDEEAFVDGHWYPTGDIMELDSDGYYRIIDRKKEIYKNIKGETVAPQKIENLFRDFDNVQQVFLVGDHRPYNTVLIYPNREAEAAMNLEPGSDDEREYFSSAVVAINKFLAPFERILDFALIDRPFSVEQEELTKKGTYKRRNIEKNFEDVISGMYQQSHISLYLGDTEVRIPNWFLREKGCLSRDIQSIEKGIAIPKLELSLTIQRDGEEEPLYRIGNYFYRVDSRWIDLQPLLTNPMYWVGNQEIFEFAGQAIFQWSRGHRLDELLTFISPASQALFPVGTREELNALHQAGEASVLGLHYSALLLQSQSEEEGLPAIDYLHYLLSDDTLPVFRFAQMIIDHPILTRSLMLRREMFKIIAENCTVERFKRLLHHYLSLNFNLLNDDVISSIVQTGTDERLNAIEQLLQAEIEERSPEQRLNKTPVPYLLTTLSEYGVKHPKNYEHIRQTIVSYQLMKEWDELVHAATSARFHLRDGFRAWLGPNQSVTIDVETGEEYSWKDVMTFNPDVPVEDKRRIIEAISSTSIIREAIFLFSKGKLIYLSDIPPGGIWISHLRAYHDKSIYRLSIQTRVHGSFDIVLNLNKQLSTDNIREETNWAVLAGSRFFMHELVEDFGGYWSKHDIWSGKFVPGETVAKYLQRNYRKGDRSTLEKVQNLWPFFVWNSAAAYFNFWRLTGKKTILADTSTDNYIVPPHDYQTGTKVVSFSERKPMKSLLDTFETFYQQFIRKTLDQYPELENKSIWNFVFSGLINAQGLDTGIAMLEEFDRSMEESKQLGNVSVIHEKLQLFLKNVKENGFIPKQLFFAVRRYHRWSRLNAAATFEAQARMLQELYDTYQLPELEKSYPETRIRFFKLTVFLHAPDPFKRVLREISDKLYTHELTEEEALALIPQLQAEFHLSDRERLFLTRLSYPHLKPSDTADLLELPSQTKQTVSLVVQFEDRDGDPFYVRDPISPKEISRLHQLFMEANLRVHFRPEHRFLVAVSDRRYIIGGLFFNYVDDNTFHMEKIVVDNRYRQKGISEALMKEFFNRLRGKGVGFVTTGFFRPEYFYRFGFKIEKKYSGLVKDLSKAIGEDKKEGLTPTERPPDSFSMEF